MKNKSVFIAYLDNKLNEYTTALNYWGHEKYKTDNNELRQKECDTNVLHMQIIYNEVLSIINDLKYNHK